MCGDEYEKGPWNQSNHHAKQQILKIIMYNVIQWEYNDVSGRNYKGEILCKTHLQLRYKLLLFAS